MIADLPFKIAFFTIVLVLIVIRASFGWKARRAGLSGRFMDDDDAKKSGTLLIIFVMLIVLALMVIFTMASERMIWLTAPFPAWLRWAGVGLGMVSFIFQIWIHAVLHNCWSVALAAKKNHVLITQGPFRRIRHPLYAAILLLFFSLAIVSAFWPFLLLAGAAIPFFHRAAGQEEALMIERFGDEYRDYIKCTGRFWPRLLRRKS